MCLGCGACFSVCPKHLIDLRDFISEGIRPVVQAGDCENCNDCLAVCPGFVSDFQSPGVEPGVDYADLQPVWGPITGIYEGHAVDPEIRHRSSSGGALTAISIFCIEKMGMAGVLHTGADANEPVRNRTRLSCDRAAVLEGCGSRYSPASVCDGLGLLESAGGPCVVVGKPSEIAALKNAEKLRSDLRARVGLKMSFFCAETPATAGTLALLRRYGVGAGSPKWLRYRGHGWPGHFAAGTETNPLAMQLGYQESWAFLQAYRPWSVQMWPDCIGELADITCGDPWYRAPDGVNPGSSLIVTRTARGKKIVEKAIRAGYLCAKPAELWKLQRSQGGLTSKKGAVWGRRMAMKILGLPVASVSGLGLFRSWTALPAGEKMKSIFGTLRRVLQRGLRRPLELAAKDSMPCLAPFVSRSVNRSNGRREPCSPQHQSS